MEHCASRMRSMTRSSTPRRNGPSEAARQRSIWSFLSTRPNWRTEVLFVVPVFLLYQVGAFYSDQLNGVDLVSTLLFRLRIASEHAFLGVSLVASAAILWLFVLTRKRERFQMRMLGPVLLESALYALLMGNAILLVMTQVFGMPLPALGPRPEGLSVWMVIYISAGAGLHEELVFRVILFGGILWGLGRVTGLGPTVSVVLALGASAVLFSLAHHIPPNGEPFTTFVFVYRLLAGVLFGLLYHYRGFATAVYTHFLYDVLVLGVWS